MTKLSNILLIIFVRVKDDANRERQICLRAILVLGKIIINDILLVIALP